MHQLSAILRTRCEVPNPYHVVDLRFSCKLPTGSNWKLGSLVVDGYNYGQGSPVVPVPSASSANGRVSSSSPQGYFPASTATRGEPRQQLSDEQKLQKLQMMLQQRRMEQQRLRPSPVTVSGPQTKPPDYSVAVHAADYKAAGTASFPSHMPNQSSNISSSNQRRQSASGSHATATATSGYMPTTQSMLQMLQMQTHQEQVTTTLQPIVIQPTDLADHCKFGGLASVADRILLSVHVAVLMLKQTSVHWRMLDFCYRNCFFCII